MNKHLQVLEFEIHS